MSGNRTGPAAADTASGDVQHVQPSSEQSDDTGKGSKTKRGRDLFQQKRDRWFRAVISHPGLRKGAPSALWYIADHAGVRQDGYSWFSHATIAAGTAMSVTAVQRAIRSAEECGLLLVVSHSSSRKPTHCYPILDGEPLAGELPNAVKHRAKVTDAKTHASGESDRCDAPHPSGSSAANIGQNSRQHRAKVTDDLLKDLSNDPSKHKRLTSSSTINYGARPTDDDDDDEVKGDVEFLFDLMGYVPSEHMALFESFLSEWPPLRHRLSCDWMEAVCRHARETGRPRQPARSFKWFVEYSRKNADAVLHYQAAHA